MASRSDELKAMAEECRRLAATIKENAARSQLLAVAEHFERLAEHHVLAPNVGERPSKPRF
jgi:hypothetical protein